jgi:hypothetical protein
MNRGGGGIRQTTDVTIVVIQRDAFASLNKQTVRARLRESNCNLSGGVLVLDDDAHPSDRGDSVVKDSRGRCAYCKCSVGEATEEGGGE